MAPARFMAIAVLVMGFALAAFACSSDEPDPGAVTAVPPDDSSETDGDQNGDAGNDAEGDAEQTLDLRAGDGEPEGVAGGADTDGPEGASETAGTRPEPTIETGKLAEEVGPILGETGDGLADQDLQIFLARRYEAFWQAVDLARQAPSATPAVDYPELAQLADGPQLEAIYEDVESLFTSGHAIRDPETPAVPGLDANSAHRVRVELEGDAVAQLYGCLVNDQVRYEVPTGNILNEAAITVTSRSTMAKSDGTWKLIRSEATALEPGVGGCWLEPEDEYPL